MALGVERTVCAQDAARRLKRSLLVKFGNSWDLWGSVMTAAGQSEIGDRRTVEDARPFEWGSSPWFCRQSIPHNYSFLTHPPWKLRKDGRRCTRRGLQGGVERGRNNSKRLVHSATGCGWIHTCPRCRQQAENQFERRDRRRELHERSVESHLCQCDLDFGHTGKQPRLAATHSSSCF